MNRSTKSYFNLRTEVSYIIHIHENCSKLGLLFSTAKSQHQTNFKQLFEWYTSAIATRLQVDAQWFYGHVWFISCGETCHFLFGAVPSVFPCMTVDQMSQVDDVITTVAGIATCMVVGLSFICWQLPCQPDKYTQHCVFLFDPTGLPQKCLSMYIHVLECGCVLIITS